jgi:glutamine synthetase adenylyltransferase
MNEYVKASIDARKKALTGTYQISEKLQKEIDELFLEIEKFGTTCADAGDFETKFAASPLNQKYIDLFTKVATADAAGAAAKSAAAGMATSTAENIARNAIGSNIPTTRAAVHQKAYDAARDIPVVGDAIEVAKNASYLGHLGKMFSKKK